MAVLLPALSTCVARMTPGERRLAERLEQKLEDDYRTLPQRGADCFVAQVVGESMNLVIPNGAWCLFRLNPAGTRQGKIVVVQHQGFEDEGNGVRLTIKRYRSFKKKGGNDEAENAQVMLLPESDQPEFEPMVFDADDADELRVVAEFLQVLR
jgi:SOS-response transcriptional repressor LexA